MAKLFMYRGDAAQFNIECKNPDGSPLDPSPGTLFFTAKSSHRQSDDDAAFSKITGSGISITDAPNGVATVTLAPSDTDLLYAPSVLLWDLQYVTAGGAPITLAAGTLMVRPDITRSTAYI